MSIETLISQVETVGDELAEKLAPGDHLALRDSEGFMLAVLTVSDIWTPDRARESEFVYETGDASHPGVAYIKEQVNPVYVGGTVEGIEEKPIHERTAPVLEETQPHVYAKLKELIEEDVREDAMTGETATAIYPPTQVIVEAFDAAIEGRRPGERLGPIVRDKPKVGRNEPCPCGSGKKFKKCCG